MARKPNYGIDAPGVIRNFFAACAACLVLALFVRGPGFFAQQQVSVSPLL
jgi:hypothetical protein